MSARPSTLPTWATSATGLARRVSPGGSAADGFVAGNRFPATWADFLFGWICDWVKYVSDGAFDGDISSSGTITATADIAAGGNIGSVTGGVLGAFVQTAEADVLHATRTLVIGTAQAHVISGFPNWVTPDNYAQQTASGSGALAFTIPIALGDRLKEVRVICNSAGGVASDVSASLVASNKAIGGASTDAATSLVGSTNMPAAVTTIQKITLNPTDTTLTTGNSFEVVVVAANSAGAKNVFRVEADFDRIA